MKEFELNNAGSKSETNNEKNDKDLKYDFLDKVANCFDLIYVRDACHIFFETLHKMEQFNSACKRVMKKADKDDWEFFTMGLIFSYFSALYVNCNIPTPEKMKRIEEVSKAFEGEMTIKEENASNTLDDLDDLDDLDNDNNDKNNKN